MNDSDAWLLGAITFFVAVFIGGLATSSIYTTKMRQECILANIQRGAGDVIAICGKP